MRRAHVRAAGKVSPASDMPAASAAVPATTSMLSQRNGGLQPGEDQDTGCNQDELS